MSITVAASISALSLAELVTVHNHFNADQVVKKFSSKEEGIRRTAAAVEQRTADPTVLVSLLAQAETGDANKDEVLEAIARKVEAALPEEAHEGEAKGKRKRKAEKNPDGKRGRRTDFTKAVIYHVPGSTNPARPSSGRAERMRILAEHTERTVEEFYKAARAEGHPLVSKITVEYGVRKGWVELVLPDGSRLTAEDFKPQPAEQEPTPTE